MLCFDSYKRFYLAVALAGPLTLEGLNDAFAGLYFELTSFVPLIFFLICLILQSSSTWYPQPIY